MTWFALTVLVLLALKWGAQLWLEHLNQRHVLAHSSAVPEPFKETIDEGAYRKSAAYTLAKSRFQQVELTFAAVLLAVLLFSGVLAAGYRGFVSHAGASAWSLALFLFVTGVVLALPGLPLDWYSQFRLEERFGFNTTSQKTWWLDRFKGLILGALLGIPLLALVLKLVDWTGKSWWLWAWGAFFGFQLLMAVLAPVLIMPLFNKFTPLHQGTLRERLFNLAHRTRFQARSIQLMDGSKRSTHSNAFFTGFGRFRKIVLYDTLVAQLQEPELEAVLAHEIGHFKRRHILKMLLMAALLSLGGFFVLSLLLHQAWFFEAFGFQPGELAPALLLFGLLGSLVTFWFSPLGHWWSRKYEYEADAFAANVMNEASSLVGALRKLNAKNLSNLTPHPLYSGFYYSHPTLLEREQALQGAAPASARE
jgi:STE24 endopeptidase